MSGGRSVPGKWAVLALRGSQTCHLAQCGQNLQTWLRPSCASSFTTSSASNWSLVPTRFLYFEIVLKGMNPNPKALGMGTWQNMTSYLPLWPLSFLLPPLEGRETTAWRLGDYSPSLHPHGPLLAGKQVSWDRVLVIGWIQVDPHAIQIFHMASRPVFGSDSPQFLMGLSPLPRVHSPLPIPVLGTVRAHGPSWMALQASVQPKSPKAALEKWNTPCPTQEDSGAPTCLFPLPVLLWTSHLSSLRSIAPSGHRAGARGTYFPPATSKKKIIFYNCWNPDWAVKSTWNQLHEW